MSTPEGFKSDNGYSTTKSLGGKTYHEIADIMRDKGFKMNHSTARNVFVKTSTGFYQADDDRPIGATPEAVSIMKSNSGPLQVKASGGIYSKEDAEKMLDAGATRLGTSSAKDIVKGNKIDNLEY